MYQPPAASLPGKIKNTRLGSQAVANLSNKNKSNFNNKNKQHENNSDYSRIHNSPRLYTTR